MVNMEESNTKKHGVMEDIGKYEGMIISVFIIALTTALMSGKLSETLFGTIMGSFIGYTFARIFNHVQGKE
ncbi:MAG: hypothetical protein PHP08_00220 [Candidatus Dojkabacteria bacterium]|nr:hypothetical protein [Candidatus Dojkabacteria bacterium]